MSDLPQICLGSVATAKGGAGFPEKYQGGQSGIPFIKVSDMNLPGNERFITTANHYVSPEIARTLGAKVFNKGDVVFAKVGAALLLNRRRILTGPTVIDNNMMALTPEQIDGEFLYHFLVGYDLAELVQTGALPSVNQRQIQGISIPDFSHQEQRGIAEVLSTLDEQIEAVEQEKAKLTQVLIGAFDDTFGQALQVGVTSAGLKSGALTAGWSRVSVLEAAQDILDFRGRTPLKIGMNWGGGDIPALSANNVQMGLVNFEKESYLGSDALYTKWMTQGKCAKNDVLMTLEAPLGNIALVPDDRKYILSQRVILLKPNKELMDGRYLSLYLRWRWFQQLLSEESTGTTAAGIQRKKLEKLPVLVAPPGMRDGITDFLFSLVIQVEDFEAEAAKLRLQKQGLMRDLLTGKVRVH